VLLQALTGFKRKKGKEKGKVTVGLKEREGEGRLMLSWDRAAN